MSVTLAAIERQEARRFLATKGLYLHHNNIWPVTGPSIPLKPPEVQAVQLLWDAEWDRLKTDIEPLMKAAAVKAAEARRRKADAKRLIKVLADKSWATREARFEANPCRPDSALEERRIHRNRPRSGPDYPEAVHGFSECHAYAPRGFKTPFKYEDNPAMWATQTLFPGGRIGGRLSYRPARPLAEDKALSIVTGDICGDPPKGRSALEARAALHA